MQRVAHVLFTFKIFLAFRVCCCFMAASTRQNDLYVRRGNNIYTNKHTHTQKHTLSGGAYAKRRKVCRTFVWACIEVKCCCLSCPLSCLAALLLLLPAATVLFLWPNANAISQGQVVQQTANSSSSNKNKSCSSNNKRKTQPAIAFDKRFCSLEKSIAKSHLADDFSY